MKNLVLHNDVAIPQIGLGSWQAMPGGEAYDAVATALRAGYRHIDTAAIYGNEEDVGQAIRDSGIPRGDIFVTTKLWNTDHGYGRAKQAFLDSLQRLGLDYIDLYLIHFPFGGRICETWKAMEELYGEGRVRAIGVSNFTTEHLDYLMRGAAITPMVDQVEYHPYLSQDPLQRYCDEHRIVIEAWSPLGSGRFVEDTNVRAIAVKHHRSIPQIILRWDIQRGVVTLPKSVHQQYIEENLDILDFRLDATDMASLNALNRDWHTGTNPELIPIDQE
ncbi:MULTISPECIES: aldo/keto reductase [Bifidobacterium]|jgi:diketogulonate reductase-like aldo/keto reductase|nr:aldo/keto reductase [Bifidobacterium tibiigranuli]MCI1210616.1 aldo/keto reductase [Bifidobacterium tibiigranuli]MCI1220826.1 aldo/keto reductase [Bifidobacterium tibiigranuli]MCI1253761.1 aldo/keto reductase [Bifidobacterium tibiigranuli]